jgi:hypothetical protein
MIRGTGATSEVGREGPIRRRACLAAAVALIALASCTSGGGPTRTGAPTARPSGGVEPRSGTGEALLQPCAKGGCRSELDAIDLANGTHRRIPFDCQDCIVVGTPTGLPGRAVLTGNGEGRPFVVDANQGSVTATTVPANSQVSSQLQTAQGPPAPGDRYVLLTSAAGDAAYLVDAMSGTTADVGALTRPQGGKTLVLGGAFSPGQRDLALIGLALWLVPTANPTQAVEVSKLGSGPSFSADGRFLSYTQARHGQGAQILVRDLANGRTTVAFSDTANGFPVARYQGSDLLVADQGRLSVVGVDGTNARLVARLPWLETDRLIPAAGGAAVVVQGAQNDQTQWAWVDRATGTVRQLPDLGEDILLGPTTPDARWLYFTDKVGLGPGPRSILALDARTGTTKEMYSGNASSCFLSSSIAAQGRMLAVVSAPGGCGSGAGRVELVDPATGAARFLVGGDAVGVAFSPDGTWLAVAVDIDTTLATQLVELSTKHVTTVRGERFVGWTTAG